MIKNVVKNILAFVSSILLLFIVAEVGFRVYTNYTSIYSIEMHKYALKLKKKSAIEGLTHEHILNSSAVLEKVQIDINSIGFRNKELTSKKENEYRIMVLGSSITLGWGVPKDSVFTVITENKLNSQNDSNYYNVVNTGIGNYNTEMQSILFRKNIDKVNPDQVILHYFINDAEEIKKGTNSWIVKHSYLFAYFYVRVTQAIALREAADHDIGNYYKDLYSDGAKGWIQAKKAMLEIQNTCKENKVPLIVIIQPDLHNISEDSPQVLCHERLHQFLDNNSIPYLDVIHAYRKEYKGNLMGLWAQKDDSHPNSIGHRIIANELSRFEKKYLNE